MKAAFEYKGYLGSAEVDVENDVLVGKLLFIEDAIGYSAASASRLHDAFVEAVDDYLASCAEDRREPDVPFKGSFNVRVGAERHRRAALAARGSGQTLNEFVCEAIDGALRAATAVRNVGRHEFDAGASRPRAAKQR